MYSLCMKAKGFFFLMCLFLFSSKIILRGAVIQSRVPVPGLYSETRDGTFERYGIPRHLPELWNQCIWMWGPASIFQNKQRVKHTPWEVLMSIQVWEITAKLA